MTKIAVASLGKTLNDQVDQRFGRCPYFIIADDQGKLLEVLDNTANEAFQGAGISAAQLVANKKVTAVAAGNFGPKAVMVLRQAGIKLYSFTGSVKDVLTNWREGKLAEQTGDQFMRRGPVNR